MIEQKMKYGVIKLLTILFTLLQLSSCNNKTSLKNDFEYVYTLEANLEGKQAHIGTCFYSNGLFYTNAHLILYKSLNEYVCASSVVARKAENNIEYRLNILNYDISNDFAELAPINSLSIGGGLNIIKDYDVTIGEDIFTIGNLNNNGLAYGYGKVTAKDKAFSNLGTYIPYVQTNIEISGGNSGGPVFNSESKVIGIMSLKLVDSSYQYVDGASFFVKIK